MKFRLLAFLCGYGCFCACSVDRIPKEYRNIGVPEDRLVSIDAMENGRYLFQQHCAICHGIQLDGRGSRSDLQPADLTSEKWYERTSPRWMFYIVREGKSHSGMLGLKDRLTETETWDIVSYILSEAVSEKTTE